MCCHDFIATHKSIHDQCAKHILRKTNVHTINSNFEQKTTQEFKHKTTLLEFQRKTPTLEFQCKTTP